MHFYPSILMNSQYIVKMCWLKTTMLYIKRSVKIGLRLCKTRKKVKNDIKR